MQKLDQHVNQNCYQNSKYNYLQGNACEQFHYENDYKLKILESFADDHLVKHQVAY
eukprot:NODE_8030_length_427_cov_57.113757_g7170_i0.p2 GENE.NODE_8030_length_427_cov_57.113757_g7170_i0~~NODE_8030_length_427_cov_57.113757_g7170_i0.p2  ORF type:complete len:56 (-),score=12.59 NODE_8030_length_427_cov_57.113757_g7170_i0:52-219(-)